MLTLTNYIKKYPAADQPVLSIEAFHLQQGIYWLKGENGSGKTSLLKSIAGVLPFSGSITVQGLDVHQDRMKYAAVVNYAEAEPRYPPFLSGEELIRFYRATKKGYYPQDFERGMGVNVFMQQKTASYSSGMIKKLSLVLAFSGNATLILLDEPLVALDVAAVDLLHTTILQYHQAGTSFLITSHQPLNSELLASTTTLLVKDKKLCREYL